MPALDGHTENVKSNYISVEDEAIQIERYIKENLNGAVYALCGLSMSGLIAANIFMRNSSKINYLILDGAPLQKNAGNIGTGHDSTVFVHYSKSKKKGSKSDPEL